MHPGGAGKSDSAIAKHVDHVTVKNWREKMTASCEIHKIETRTASRGGSTYQQNTANIGRRPPSPPGQPGSPPQPMSALSHGS